MNSLYYQGLLQQKPTYSYQKEPVEEEPEVPEETGTPENIDDENETETEEDAPSQEPDSELENPLPDPGVEPDEGILLSPSPGGTDNEVLP